MRAKVQITFEIESDEYYLVSPTEDSVKKLIKEMLDGKADFPDKRYIEVEEL